MEIKKKSCYLDLTEFQTYNIHFKRFKKNYSYAYPLQKEY